VESDQKHGVLRISVPWAREGSRFTLLFEQAALLLVHVARRSSPDADRQPAVRDGVRTRLWTVSRASVYRSLKETPPNTIARRPGPVGACSDAELADHIRRQIAASCLHGEGYCKLWARLRFAGVRASPRRVRRVMGENGLLAPLHPNPTHKRDVLAERCPHCGTDVSGAAQTPVPAYDRIEIPEIKPDVTRVTLHFASITSRDHGKG
jgi:hypothetical protein